MKRVVIDTNVLIDLFEGNNQPVGALEVYDGVILPPIVLGEYRAGLFPTERGREGRRKLDAYLNHSTVEVAPVTDRTAELYAKIFQALRKEGRPIPQNDIWIAASAMEHGADLLTADAHFQAVPMLTVVFPDR